MSSTPLPCVFWGDDVLCSHRKSMKVMFLNRCPQCPYYLEFEREMDEEEDEFFAEVDEFNEVRAKFERGELTKDEFDFETDRIFAKYFKRGKG